MRGSPRAACAVAVVAWGVAVGGVGATPSLLGPPTPSGGEPVVVSASFVLRDINRIDDEAEAFEFDAILTLAWHDPRQAFDPEQEGVDEKVYQGAFQFNEVFTGWFPQMVLVNQAGLYEKRGVVLAS